MRVGLNAGFGDPLASELAGIAAHGFALVRQDVYAKSTDLNVDLIREFVNAPLGAIFLIGGGKIQVSDGSRRIEPHELAQMTKSVVACANEVGLLDYAIEIGNEPDIAHPGYSERPQDFAEAIRQSHDAARQSGFTGEIISGGISNLNDRGLTYLDTMLDCESFPAVTIGFHRYPEEGRGPRAPHDSFRSRDDEFGVLQHIADNAPVACTEFGYHTAAARPLTLTDIAVAGCVLWDLAFYETRFDANISLACVYQLNDGPTENYIDRYGIRYSNGNWKPVAQAIAAVYG